MRRVLFGGVTDPPNHPGGIANIYREKNNRKAVSQ